MIDYTTRVPMPEWETKSSSLHRSGGTSEQLGQVAAVLPRDPGDQCPFLAHRVLLQSFVVRSGQSLADAVIRRTASVRISGVVARFSRT